MADFTGLTPCSYLPKGAQHILTVGWLSKGSAYPVGATPREVYDRLVEFAKDPWQPFVYMGSHECEICQFTGEASGCANLFFPFDQRIYVCPGLIVHYINAHHYQPPAEFCEAVLACPPMRTMDYKKRLLECNGSVLWKD